MGQDQRNAAYRLGIDLGTNSLGWCVLDLSADLSPVAVREMGVRIFSDGRDAKSGASLAVDRRTPVQRAGGATVISVGCRR